MTTAEPPTLKHRLGENVRRIRLANGLTQAELADVIEWHQPDISDLENGHRWPEEETLAKLARALKVDAADLLGR